MLSTVVPNPVFDFIVVKPYAVEPSYFEPSGETKKHFEIARIQNNRRQMTKGQMYKGE